MTAKPLTGSKVFMFTASAFAVIIGVNLTMAFKAVSTFPGLETRNSYVASQSFDRERAAQQELGWTARAWLADGLLHLTITDADGRPVAPLELSALIGRPARQSSDMAIEFSSLESERYTAPLKLKHGQWSLRITARSTDGTAFRQVLTLYQGTGGA